MKPEKQSVIWIHIKKTWFIPTHISAGIIEQQGRRGSKNCRYIVMIYNPRSVVRRSTLLSAILEAHIEEHP